MNIMVLTPLSFLFLTFQTQGSLPADQVVAQSKELVVRWSGQEAKERNLPPHQNYAGDSWSLQVDFENLNGGPSASLARLEEFLAGNDKRLRRAAAIVIGSIRFQAENEPGGWTAIRDRELSLAATYVDDQDPETAANATRTFIYMGSRAWKGWGNFQPNWAAALSTATGDRARRLAAIFAFTSAPVDGTVPGLLHIFETGNDQVQGIGKIALCRTAIADPSSLTAITGAISAAIARDPRKGYQSLEALGGCLWSQQAPNRFVGSYIGHSDVLQSIWMDALEGTTAKGATADRNQAITETQNKFLSLVESGLKSSDVRIQTSSAYTILSIGREMDAEQHKVMLGYKYGDQKAVTRLLTIAAAKMQSPHPEISKAALGVLMSFEGQRSSS